MKKKITNYSYNVNHDGTLTIFTNVNGQTYTIATLEECVKLTADEAGIRELIEQVLTDLGYKLVLKQKKDNRMTKFNLTDYEKGKVINLYNTYEYGSAREKDVIIYFEKIRPKSYKYAVDKLAREYGVNPRKCSSTEEIFEKLDDNYLDFLLDLVNVLFIKCNIDFDRLPQSYIVNYFEINTEGDIGDALCKYLSDMFGFCIKSLDYEIHEDVNEICATHIVWDED